MNKLLPVVLGLVILPAFGFGQAADPKAPSGTMTVEEKKLQSTVEVQVIASLVAEDDRGDKEKALDYLAAMIDKGKVSNKSQDVLSLLDELGSEGTSKQVVEKGRVINDFPDVRRRAAELLGQVGGDQARETLISMALRDKEPMVTAEAVYSLGLIGAGDQQARVENLIVSLVKNQDIIKPDSNFAFAAVSALEMLGKKNNGKVSSEVFAALVRVQKGNYIRPVREKAAQVLDSFTQY